ncbi:MAG: hypothetical protein JWQ19_3291 [Subtercola sp.]|nr:hypothetical protein [Subtercola sp.]
MHANEGVPLSTPSAPRSESNSLSFGSNLSLRPALFRAERPSNCEHLARLHEAGIRVRKIYTRKICVLDLKSRCDSQRSVAASDDVREFECIHLGRGTRRVGLHSGVSHEGRVGRVATVCLAALRIWCNRREARCRCGRHGCRCECHALRRHHERRRCSRIGYAYRRATRQAGGRRSEQNGDCYDASLIRHG